MIRTLIAMLAVVLAVTACRDEVRGTAPAEAERSGPEDRAGTRAEASRASDVHLAQRCSEDDDCVATREMYVDQANDSCCRSCNTQPVSRSWLPSALADCESMGSVGCPAKKCAALESVACVDGKCTVAKPASP